MLLAEIASDMHVPVLLPEILRLLQPVSSRVYVDATLGYGGYSEAILRASAPGGRVVAIDCDRDATAAASERLAGYHTRLDIVQGSFADLETHLDRLGLPSVHGIVADLGLSTSQLDRPERGFSFSKEGPLDMRFDRGQRETAAELVDRSSQSELEEILRSYGEERRARAIAKRIVARRPLRTTSELRRAIVSVLGPRRGGIDPATRTFQALRIAVNRELDALDALLRQAPFRLAPGGRLVVVSYHSLEDRAVKLAFRELARAEPFERFRLLTRKPIAADAEEVRENPRARSAKLRAIERLS